MLHIDLPSRSEIEALAARRGAPSVSIYLSTTPLSQEARNDRITLKNLLRVAAGQIEAAGLPKRALHQIEQSVGALIDDHDFWTEQAHSLAVFATPESLRTFRLPNRIGEIVEVSDRFHLKPLLRAVTFPHDAFVLAIGMGAVRLVEVTADLPAQVVSVPDLPRDANQAIGRRSHLEKRGDMQSGERTSEHALLSRYSRAVDQALRPVLAGDERPLIVAASEPLASIFRAVSSYPHLAEEGIAGGPDRTPDHELAAAARPILDRIYAARIRALAELFALRENQGRATGDVAQAARAATFGAIDVLIFDMDEVIAGTVADDDGAVSFADAPGAGSYGIVDEIAARALRSGARVLAVRRDDVPGRGSLAAILRYPA